MLLTGDCSKDLLNIKHSQHIFVRVLEKVWIWESVRRDNGGPLQDVRDMRWGFHCWLVGNGCGGVFFIFYYKNRGHFEYMVWTLKSYPAVTSGFDTFSHTFGLWAKICNNNFVLFLCSTVTLEIYRSHQHLIHKKQYSSKYCALIVDWDSLSHRPWCGPRKLHFFLLGGGGGEWLNNKKVRVLVSEQFVF